MSFEIVLATSAAIAFLNQEAGFALVQQQLKRSGISAVNFAEVITVLINCGMNAAEAVELASSVFLQVIPFDHSQAMQAASLRAQTKDLGLSLGDCACLALAQTKKLPVLTADQAWPQLALGINVELIR